jgi:hypothetical protein
MENPEANAQANPQAGQASQDGQMQQVMQMVQQMLQQGAQPEQIAQQLVQMGIPQEQVMQIASALAGFTMGQADLLRRAMGKKKADEMAKMKELFVTGGVAKGFPKNKIEKMSLSAEQIEELKNSTAFLKKARPNPSFGNSSRGQREWLV